MGGMDYALFMVLIYTEYCPDKIESLRETFYDS